MLWSSKRIKKTKISPFIIKSLKLFLFFAFCFFNINFFSSQKKHPFHPNESILGIDDTNNEDKIITNEANETNSVNPIVSNNDEDLRESPSKNEENIDVEDYNMYFLSSEYLQEAPVAFTESLSSYSMSTSVTKDNIQTEEGGYLYELLFFLNNAYPSFFASFFQLLFFCLNLVFICKLFNVFLNVFACFVLQF